MCCRIWKRLKLWKKRVMKNNGGRETPKSRIKTNKKKRTKQTERKAMWKPTAEHSGGPNGPAAPPLPVVVCPAPTEQHEIRLEKTQPPETLYADEKEKNLTEHALLSSDDLDYTPSPDSSRRQKFKGEIEWASVRDDTLEETDNLPEASRSWSTDSALEQKSKFDLRKQ